MAYRFTEEDAVFMARALRVAETETFSPHPNPRVGCVLVNNGKVVGEGWHVAAGGPHAEVHALTQAGDAAQGATAYVTLEPCSHHGRTPPCADALIQAGVARVIVAMQDPNPKVAGSGIKKLKKAGVDVGVGLMQAEAEALNRGFISRMTTGRPFVRCKLAMSVDGRTAMSDGESKWITGEAARKDVQRWRARSDAVLTSLATVDADDPSLTVREEQLGEKVRRQPVRVVLDSHLHIHPQTTVLREQGKTWIFACHGAEGKQAILTAAGGEVITIDETDGHLDLAAVLDELGRREINEVLVEAGSILNGALLQAQLIDEIVLYMAPHLMGNNARGLFTLSGLAKMQDRVELTMLDVRAVGKDWRFVLKPIYKKKR
ncbi:MAG: bifunctional diaminohydroxyphosphoribosylaminopyrimidine deaminase/5-amino-6-(5-phosphoribosylamino)uracil reductase RibD [Gammaproteobacteria bacterium]|nr:bifunctional diaminohydroxyphosphoribosylaminopyrimidine deaminase/5-amino-6-(5-phosphoribosylamino)uracil reductase RibD [Gammaproteobacteria bacterium]